MHQYLEKLLQAQAVRVIIWISTIEQCGVAYTHQVSQLLWPGLQKHKKTNIKTYPGVLSMQNILADVAVSVSELKKNPSAVLSGANGLPLAVLNHNRVMDYMVPANARTVTIKQD